MRCVVRVLKTAEIDAMVLGTKMRLQVERWWVCLAYLAWAMEREPKSPDPFAMGGGTGVCGTEMYPFICHVGERLVDLSRKGPKSTENPAMAGAVDAKCKRDLTMFVGARFCGTDRPIKHDIVGLWSSAVVLFPGY